MKVRQGLCFKFISTSSLLRLKMKQFLLTRDLKLELLQLSAMAKGFQKLQRQWSHGYPPNTLVHFHAHTLTEILSPHCLAFFFFFALILQASWAAPAGTEGALDLSKHPQMKVWGSSLLFCLCHLCQGNKCSTVCRLGIVSAEVTMWRLDGPSQSRYHFSPQRPTAVDHQTVGPSCTTGCPLPVQSAKVIHNQAVMMHICVCVCVCGQGGM